MKPEAPPPLPEGLDPPLWYARISLKTDDLKENKQRKRRPSGLSGFYLAEAWPSVGIVSWQNEGQSEHDATLRAWLSSSQLKYLQEEKLSKFLKTHPNMQDL